MLLEKTLESPLDCKEIQPVHSEGDQSWIFIRRTDAEAKTPILWPPDAKNRLIGNGPDAGKDWRWEDEMDGWHHRLNGHSLSKLRELVMDREGWRAAVCEVTESDMTEQPNWTELLALFTHSSPSFLDRLYNYYLEFSQINFLSPPHLVLLVWLYLFPSFETCSSGTSFCLPCCFYFYVSGRSVKFFWPERNGLLWKMSFMPQCHTPFWSPELFALVVPTVWLCGSFCCDRLILWVVWWMWLVPVWFVARP